MMKYITLYLILLLNFSELFSQPLTLLENEKAHRRYWYYRTRFINDFVKIGDEQGDCVCFPERNYDYSAGGKNNYNLYFSKVGPDQIDIMNQYLSALALEYKILSRSNQSTQETLKEIFYIIKAINRLDSRADWFWMGNGVQIDNMNGYPESANLNGFILREDMPNNYFGISNNLKHFNYSLKEYNSTATDANLSYTGLHKTDKLTYDNKFSNSTVFSASNPSTNDELKQDLSLPHDKYYSMFIAFMLLIKYLPDNAVYVENNVVQTFQDGHANIKTEIRNITNRCHSYMRGNTFGNNITNWQYELPDGTNIQNYGTPVLYSYPVSEMICLINSSFPSWNGITNCNSYQDAVSGVIGNLSYTALHLNPIPGDDAAVFLANCQAGSNLPFGVVPTFIAMDLNAAISGVEWAELLRKVLHQTGGLMKQKSVFADPINEAPCVGPYNIAPCVKAPCEWSSQDRLEHPSKRGAGCGNCAGYGGNNLGNANPGNYPGVDYMLLHNLYYEYLNQQDDKPNITEAAAYKNAYNLMDNYDEQIWPQKSGPVTYGVNLINSTKTPMYVKVFQNLKSNAIIYATASPLAPNNTISSKVEYRAGKDITLLPEDAAHQGFEVKLGSDFHAYIKRYICSEGDYGNGLKQANQEPTVSNDYENDEMNTLISTHYVEHTKSDSDLYPYANMEDNATNLTSEEIQKQLIEAHNYANLLDDYLRASEIDNLASKQRFMVLPNPNNGIFKVYATTLTDNEVFTITIFDMKGQQISNYQNLNETVNLEIDLSKYSKGIYMINLSSNFGYTDNKKVSVE